MKARIRENDKNKVVGACQCNFDHKTLVESMTKIPSGVDVLPEEDWQDKHLYRTTGNIDKGDSKNFPDWDCYPFKPLSNERCADSCLKDPACVSYDRRKSDAPR